MKKLIALLVIMPTLIFGQTHLKNQQFIDFSITGYDGFSANNYAFQLGYGKYNKKTNASIVELNYAHKLANVAGNQNIIQSIQIPVQQIFMSYTRNFALIRNYNNTFIFSVFAKANVGYEAINRNENQVGEYLLNNKSDYLLGIGLGPNVEYNNFHIGLANNLNFISQSQKFSIFPFLKYRFHL